MRHKIVIALNTTWNLVNFRVGLIRALTAAGYKVVVFAPPDNYTKYLPSLGCRYLPLPMDNQGTHPGRDAVLLLRFWSFLRRERPDVFLGYTIKPNIYGSLAANMLRIPVVNNIAGLGFAFVRQGWLGSLVRVFYKLALSRSYRVFFQNDDDLRIFIGAGLVNPRQSDRLPGSGIDLNRFVPAPFLRRDKVRFLLVARMLWDKGVGEFVEAARLIRRSYPNAEFCLLGFLDAKNPSAVSRKQIADWVAEGVVNYLGVSDDVRNEIADADCVVLPSYYREGVPRALLEAAAMARLIITADTVGCRDVVDEGQNGFLCRPRDPTDLAQAMEKVMRLPLGVRVEMGVRGRAKVEREFDEKIVIQKYLDVISNVIRSRSSSSLR